MSVCVCVCYYSHSMQSQHMGVDKILEEGVAKEFTETHLA